MPGTDTYFLYDNCDLSDAAEFLKHSNKSWHWYTQARRVELATNGARAPLTEAYEQYQAGRAAATRRLANVGDQKEEEKAVIKKTGATAAALPP